jgi:hypothetical protein
MPRLRWMTAHCSSGKSATSQHHADAQIRVITSFWWLCPIQPAHIGDLRRQRTRQQSLKT